MNEMYVVTFNSTHYAIKFEKILKDADIKMMMIPSPREITASCGLSIKFDQSDVEKVTKHIEESHVDIYGIFKLTKIAGEKEKQVQKIF